MLSGESANGKYPVECVKTMSKLCFEAENCVASRKLFANRIAGDVGKLSTVESLGKSIASLAMDIKAAAIISFTPDGELTRYISRCRPTCPVLSHSTEQHVVKYMSVYRGVMGRRVASFNNKEENIKHAISAAKEMGIAKTGEQVIVVYQNEDTIEKSKDLLRVVNVE